MRASGQTTGQMTGQYRRTRDTCRTRRALSPGHQLQSLSAITGHPRRASAGRHSQPSVPSRNRNRQAVRTPQRTPKAGAPPHEASGATACRHTRPTNHATGRTRVKIKKRGIEARGDRGQAQILRLRPLRSGRAVGTASGGPGFFLLAPEPVRREAETGLWQLSRRPTQHLVRRRAVMWVP